MDENFTFENPVFEPDIVDDDLNDDFYSDQQGLVRNNGDDIIETPVYSKSSSKTKQLKTQVKESKIQSWLKHLGIKSNINPLYLDNFSIAKDQGLNVLKFKKPGGSEIILDDLRSKTGKFRSPRQIMRDIGGAQSLKEIIDFKGSPQQLEDIIDNTTEAIKAENQKIKKSYDEIPTDLEMDDMSNKDLVDSISKIETNIRNIATNTELDMREFLGVDKALQRISGEFINNTAKLSEIDAHIKRENEKLKDEYINEHQKERYKDRIKALKEERQVRLEIMSQNREELQSQYARIRQTLEKILDGDMTLREKIKTIFREHGITITAILIAFGLIIETIVTSITGASSGGGSNPPSKPKQVKNWLKNKLKALMRLLGRLAQKAAAALPGIIGSIIAGVLNFLKSALGFAAEHITAFITFIVGLIVYKLYELFQKPKRKNS